MAIKENQNKVWISTLLNPITADNIKRLIDLQIKQWLCTVGSV